MLPICSHCLILPFVHLLCLNGLSRCLDITYADAVTGAVAAFKYIFIKFSWSIKKIKHLCALFIQAFCNTKCMLVNGITSFQYYSCTCSVNSMHFECGFHHPSNVPSNQRQVNIKGIFCIVRLFVCLLFIHCSSSWLLIIEHWASSYLLFYSAICLFFPFVLIGSVVGCCRCCYHGRCQMLAFNHFLWMEFFQCIWTRVYGTLFNEQK